MNRHGALCLTAIMYVMGAIALLPVAIFAEGVPDFSAVSPQSWLVAAYLGVFCSGIAFFLCNFGLVRMDASKAAVFAFLEPVVAIFIVTIFMGETVTLFMLAGCALVLFGIYVTERK